MKEIRRPTLADYLLAASGREIDDYLYLNYMRKCQDQLRMAHKFVLDDQAATYLGQMVHDYPRIIADAQDFAIRPFDLMWVEIPFAPYHQAVSGLGPDTTSDTVVGYLFVGPTVIVGVRSDMRISEAKFLPIEYHLHKPMTIEEQFEMAKLCETSRVGLDMWFWGDSAAKFLPPLPQNEHGAVAALSYLNEWGKEGLRSLRANHSVTPIPLDKKVYETYYPKLIKGSGGDLRNIIAVLLFLNRTADVQYVRDIGMGQTLINRRPRPMLPHKVITLKLNPLPRLAALVAGSGIRRRLHDVRGHFCHDKRARAGCQHGTQTFGDWGEWWVEYEPLRWECSECKGHRWWRHEHHRGNSDAGVIREQTYSVTK